MLWTGCDTRHLYSPTFSPTELHRGHKNPNAIRAQPLLLMARLCVEQALRDCLRTHAGEPTQDARDAFEWLSQDLDWTRKPGTPIPPAEIRGEIIFSFCWCASLLDLDINDIREHGLLRLSGLAHNSKAWLPGLPDIKRHWARAKTEYEERMAQGQQPPDQQQEVMSASA